MTERGPMWESMTREQLRDEAVRQAQIANGAMADADRLRDAAVRQARIAHDAMIWADQLRAALERIRRDEGKVCEGFTECEHRACQSSYTAWAIADEALRHG